MSPFPNAKVIPDGWAAHHRPVAEGTMKTPAVFYRLADGPAPFPEPPGWTGKTAIWTAKVRVQALTSEQRAADAAEQTVSLRQYLVTAPVSGPALKVGQRADQVHVLGRVLRIVDITPGTYLWEMDLRCEEMLSQAGPVKLEVPDGS